MELLLQRFSTGDESTLGILHRDMSGLNADPPLEPSFRCFTMEDAPNEPKISGKTRIPAGRYQILVRREGSMHKRYSKRFAWHDGMLWLQKVPGFEWIYIHPGNIHEHTDGCILTGDGCQSNVLDDGMVLASVNAYKRLYAEIINCMKSGQEVWITIEDFA